MQLGHRNAPPIAGQTGSGLRRNLDKSACPPQRRHSNRSTAGSFRLLSHRYLRGVKSSTQVRLSCSDFHNFYYAVLRCGAPDDRPAAFERVPSPQLRAAGHGEGAALKHLSEHVPDDILHPVVITALGIHIELVFSAAPGLLLSSNTEQKPPRSSRARENEQQSRRAQEMIAEINEAQRQRRRDIMAHRCPICRRRPSNAGCRNFHARR